MSQVSAFIFLPYFMITLNFKKQDYHNFPIVILLSQVKPNVTRRFWQKNKDVSQSNSILFITYTSNSTKCAASGRSGFILNKGHQTNLDTIYINLVGNPDQSIVVLSRIFAHTTYTRMTTVITSDLPQSWSRCQTLLF